MQAITPLAPRLEALRLKYGGIIKPEISAILEGHIEFLRASGVLEKALQFGDAAPPFALEDGHGDIVRSEELLQMGPLVVSFFRGTWCPYCVTELRALSEVASAIADRGAALVVISPESPGARDRKIEDSLDLTILYDEDNAVARSFGLAYDFPKDLRDLYLDVFGNDIAKTNGVEAWQLPIPARYVIDVNGTIVDAEIDPDYRYRPEPGGIIAVLDRLGKRARHWNGSRSRPVSG
jgi:peroxiredoxin